jgi:TatD DNase family protein
MIIDSHCHLDYPILYDQLDKVIARAKQSNIKYLLTICTTLNSFNKIKTIIDKYENIYGTFGIHPHETKNSLQIDSKYISNLKKKHTKIVGIGETGLDYYYNHSSKDIQKKSFINHIKAAIELNIPVIVHSRNAEKDTYEILKSEKKNSNLKVLIHCFTGSKEFAKKLIDIGCYISLSGIITFKNSQDLIDAVSIIPLERLLVETDAPYLSPAPNRGKSNEPSYILHTVKKLSEIKNVSIDTIESKTSNNFINLFNIN